MDSIFVIMMARPVVKCYSTPRLYALKLVWNGKWLVDWVTICCPLVDNNHCTMKCFCPIGDGYCLQQTKC